MLTWFRGVFLLCGENLLHFLGPSKHWSNVLLMRFLRRGLVNNVQIWRALVHLLNFIGHCESFWCTLFWMVLGTWPWWIALLASTKRRLSPRSNICWAWLWMRPKFIFQIDSNRWCQVYTHLPAVLPNHCRGILLWIHNASKSWAHELLGLIGTSWREPILIHLRLPVSTSARREPLVIALRQDVFRL